jgi:cell division control protein 6
MTGFDEVPQRIISDYAKLEFDYVPDKLVHRDAQMKQLTSIFKSVVEAKRSQIAFLYGGVGTGKSALSKRFCLDFREWARIKGKRAEFVVVNCRSRNTPSGALLKILDKFQPNFPDRGFSTTEMLEILRKQITKESILLVVILDEVDMLIKRSGSDLLYSLSRFDDEKVSAPKHSLSLILISQRNIHDFLDAATISTIKRTNQIGFDKYSKEELKDIVGQRVELAFFPGTVEEDVIAFIAEISTEFGDARFAIELLENAGRIANEEGADSVGPEHVRTAKAMTYSVVTESKLEPLERHMMFTLLAVSRTIKKKTFVTTGEVEDIYALVCEEYAEEPRAHTRFWEYLKHLGDAGLLGLSASGKGMVGKTTLISLPDIPAGVLEEKVITLLK